MLAQDYPKDKLHIIVINDRSTDTTAEICESFAKENDNIHVVHRPFDAVPGKPAAIKELADNLKTDIIVFFDADYLPERHVVKELVVPFIDPHVGATMGRVSPYNANKNTLTRLIDLERRSGYVIDQNVRAIWNLLPQFGGTVGGIRLSALKQIGGWDPTSLAEDTDVTYRLFLNGWTVEYVNHTVCYEECPEHWAIRYKQVRRWAYGHNQCLLKYFNKVLSCKHQHIFARIDAFVLLFFYLYPSISFLSLILSFVVPFYIENFTPFFALVPVLFFLSGINNIASYIQMIAASIYDSQQKVCAWIPLIFISNTINMLASLSSVYLLIKNKLKNTHLGWDKTTRYRES